MTTAHVTPELRFEGLVAIAATRHFVWSQLTSPDVLAQITPGVASAQIIQPQRAFRIQIATEIAGQAFSFPTDIIWTNITPPHILVWEAQADIKGRSVAVHGLFELREELETEIVFSAETTTLPNALNLPPALMRGIISHAITNFFTRFKQYVEQNAPA
ncbi:MAG: SRPBCC domain-containing protein [Anaerolineae bacterium]|nr:SRPBCC domain-containing protein [Anaerolineae bacterium]MCO5193673.1 SRPBCC domain-containing protein [Anaerolineae bacterium]MCO5199745.1 SRPBCC domain-containing protein [Anaerolineae bacterium]MCO5206545.1 SRPBCC domain-containing protein [Anaerolineae bacterium]